MMSLAASQDGNMQGNVVSSPCSSGDGGDMVLRQPCWGVEGGQGMEATTNLGMATRTVERIQTVSVGWSVYCLVTPVP